MRTKLKLQLDDLAVDSFNTAPADRPKGTVFGEQCTCWTQCGQNTCPGCPTCDYTCVNTCDDATCANTCAAGCAYSDYCNSYQPCPSAQYTHCGNIICY